MKPARVVDDVTGEVYVRRVVGGRCACGKRKYRYSSKKIALAEAHRQTRNSGERIEAYKCLAGHCYHLGHPLGSRSRS